MIWCPLSSFGIRYPYILQSTLKNSNCGNPVLISLGNVWAPILQPHIFNLFLKTQLLTYLTSRFPEKNAGLPMKFVLYINTISLQYIPCNICSILMLKCHSFCILFVKSGKLFAQGSLSLELI